VSKERSDFVIVIGDAEEQVMQQKETTAEEGKRD
jgi:hypothetical protein